MMRQKADWKEQNEEWDRTHSTLLRIFIVKNNEMWRRKEGNMRSRSFIKLGDLATYFACWRK